MNLENSILPIPSEVALLGMITRAPKSLGWNPSYTKAWDELWKKFEKDQLDKDYYEQFVKTELKLLLEDYTTQQNLLKYWPEFEININKISKNKQKVKLKQKLKEISFINHLGPYKGWLFPTSFSEKLEIKIEKGFRSIHPEPEFNIEIPDELSGAMSDGELQSILLNSNLLKKDGKSKIYTYKINNGKVFLPTNLEKTLSEYGKIIAQKLGFSQAGGFTIDYMISEKDSKLVLCPIELHLTPLGIVHDFKNTGLAEKTDQFIQSLANTYSKIIMYTTEECLKQGFSLTEIEHIKKKLKKYGSKVVVTADSKELDTLPGWFVLPYKADFESMNGNPTILPKANGIKMENKYSINDLLNECEIEGVAKPGYKVLDSMPQFYKIGKTFTNPVNLNKDMPLYKKWKHENNLADWVVIKPINHHDWKPQILYLKDLTDAAILFKHLNKYGEIIVEEMVKPNKILGNGEIRVFYQAKQGGELNEKNDYI